MLQPPLNNVLVKVKRKYAENATSKIFKLAEIQNQSSVSAADCVQITGEVVALPLGIGKGVEYEGFTTKDIMLGDIAIFRYDVIFDFVQQKQDENAEPEFKNRIWYNGVEYFLADIRKIFGVIRGEQIIMINGYVMVEEFEESKIVLPQHLKRTKQSASTSVLYTGHPKLNQKIAPISQMDKVLFNPFTAQHYEIKGKKFCIIPQDKIFGKEIK